jgi:hypothetical protein
VSVLKALLPGLTGGCTELAQAALVDNRDGQFDRFVILCAPRPF